MKLDIDLDLDVCEELKFEDEVDVECLDEDVEQTPEEEASDVLKKFFEGEQYFCGGPIPEGTHCSRSYITSLLCYDLLSAIDKVHLLLEGNEYLPVDNDCDAEASSQVICTILGKIQEKKIDNHFAGGLLLVGLELLYGVNAC